ncbi:MAG: ABC transporter permease [Pirellulaceae bacterium]|nr:ABC transporter permease [Pirellulaceae bacterium]
MPMGKISVREILSRPTRALLTFTSIVIGVAAVVSVFLTTANTRVAQREMLRAVSGRADLEIIANGVLGFAYDTLEKTRQTSGVKLAAPAINRFAVLFAGERRAKARVLGIDPRVDQEVRDYKVVEGRGLETMGEVLVDGSFARSLQIKLDDPLRILGKGGLSDVKVVGIVEPSGGSGVAVGSSVYAILPEASRWFRAGSRLDQIQIVLDDPEKSDDVLKALQAVTPAEATVQAPATRSQMAEETMFATENGLHMAIAFALLISLFIIYNTFQMSVGERRKQLGILRALGTTRNQVRWMILREALVMSLLASAVGCGLGVYGATFLSRATQQVLQVSLPVIQISVWPLVVAVIFGVSISLLGAYLPANRASSVQPLEAIRSLDTGQDAALIRIATPIGIFALVVGALVLWLATRGRLPLGGDVVGIVMLLLGLVLMIPISLPMISMMLMSLMRPWLGPPAMLAQRQLMRHLGRSTLTIGVLFVAVGTSIGMAGNVLDNVGNVQRWYKQAMIGDFFVRASMPDIATGAAADLPLEAEDAVRKISGVEQVSSIAMEQARSDDSSVLVVARDFRKSSLGLFEVTGDEREKVIKGLTQGQVVVGSVLAQRKNIQPGGTMQLETASGPTNFDVAAVVNDYLGGGLTVYMDAPVAKLALGMEGADVLVIQADDSRLAEVEKSLRAYCGEQGLVLQSYAQLIGVINGMVNGVIAS